MVPKDSHCCLALGYRSWRITSRWQTLDRRLGSADNTTSLGAIAMYSFLGTDLITVFVLIRILLQIKMLYYFKKGFFSPLIIQTICVQTTNQACDTRGSTVLDLTAHVWKLLFFTHRKFPKDYYYSKTWDADRPTRRKSIFCPIFVSSADLTKLLMPLF